MRGRGQRRGFLLQNLIIIHCLLDLVDDDDFHLCFSGIVTVFVAVTTWGWNYFRVVLKHLSGEKGVLYFGRPKGTCRDSFFGEKVAWI